MVVGGRITQRGRARREQLLDVALHAFAAKGYRGTSLAAIADEVGLSEPGLLHHFPSKSALVEATLEHHGNRARARAAAVAGGRAPSFPERLVRLAGRHERDPSFIRLLIVMAAESIEPEHPTREWFARRYDAVAAAFERELAADQGSGQLAADVDTAALARILMAALDGLQLQFLLSRETYEMVEPLRALLAAFYGPGSTGPPDLSGS